MALRKKALLNKQKIINFIKKLLILNIFEIDTGCRNIDDGPRV